MLKKEKKANDLKDLNHYCRLFEQVDIQTTVITANTCLKDHLTKQYLKYKREKKQYVVLRDIFMSFEGFIDSLYSEAQMLNPFLSSIISDDEARFLLLSYLKEDPDVFMPNVAEAKHLFSAWQVLQQWNLSIKDVKNEEDNKNVRLFLRWIKRYQNTLTEHNWIDKSLSATLLLRKSKVLKETLKNFGLSKVILVGFHTLTPQMEVFFEHCKGQFDIVIYTWTLPNIKSNVKITEYLEDQLEIQKIAKQVFALSQIEPEVNIGVIVPDLQEQLSTLVDAFDQYFVFDEYKQNPLLDNSMRGYTISGGESLLSQSISYQLMLWLKFDKISSFDDIKLMLGSSYLKGHDNFKSKRYQKLQALKAKVPQAVEFGKLVKLKLFTDNCDPVLLEVISNMIIFNKSQEKRHKITAFVFIEKLKQVLSILGYLDNLILTSLEHQALEQFYTLVNKLIMLTRLDVQLEFNQWLIELESLASNTLFQMETTANPRVHILGMIEATEVFFDHLFVIRMTDVNWPRFSNMSPYLPLFLQRSNHMPNSSVERELEFAKVITKRLTKMGRNIHLSYSLLNGEKIQILSPLLISMGQVNIDHSKVEDKIKIPMSFNLFEDNTLLLITPQVCQQIKGGSQVFKNFAECPYRAALIHHLNLNGDKVHKPILSALEKGVIIHYVLEKIWRKLKSSHNLINTSKEALEKDIEKHIRSALNEHVLLINMLPKLLKNVEIMRLKEVVLKWLEYEKLRHEPFKVLALEKVLKCTISGVTLKLRLDRIDQLAENHTVVIDYKTSKSYQITDLLKIPITESQLPLYAIYEDTDAVAVATVNGAKIGLQSISSIDNWIKEGDPKTYPAKKMADDSPKTYVALKQYWHTQLQQQMSNFVAGESIVTPSASSCQYCEFSIVCRMSYF